MSDEGEYEEKYRYWNDRWWERHEALCRRAQEEFGSYEEICDDPELEERRRERVQELKEGDEAFQRAKRERVAIVDRFLQERCPEGSTAGQIRTLKADFPAHIGKIWLAEYFDVTESYVQSFRSSSKGDVLQNKVDAELRQEVIKRDGQACTRCGGSDDLVVHHIIPIRASTEEKCDEPENLATLCGDCHLEAHGGNFYSGVPPYGTVEEFWEWTNSEDS